MRITTRLIELLARPLASLTRVMASRDDRDDRHRRGAKDWTWPFVENLEAELVSLDSILHGF